MHFFINDTATTEIYTLSLHDALPICPASGTRPPRSVLPRSRFRRAPYETHPLGARSEEHTSELQSLRHLVCRLLLEKKKSNRHRSDPSYRLPRVDTDIATSSIGTIPR